jgi:hypothetical protein
MQETLDVTCIFTDIQLSSVCKDSHKLSKIPGYSSFNLRVVDIDTTTPLSTDCSCTDFDFQISPQENI